MKKKKHKVLKELVFAAIVVSVVLLSLAAIGAVQAGCPCEDTDECDRYPIMRPDSETCRIWQEQYDEAPTAPIDPEIKIMLESSSPTYYNLISHLNYVPAQRDQGSCGNCWGWAGTGVTEIALDVQEGIFERLSVQYLNSKYSGGAGSGWACCGGSASDFASWYQSEGFIIPWSNTNANWQDGGERCCVAYNPDGSCGTYGGTSVPLASISTTPQYGIKTCSASRITTTGISRKDAIANIKNVLHQEKAIYFSYCLATGENWTDFFDFWDWDTEDAVWSFNPYCGQTCDGGKGCHAVLCVGYNDTNPDEAYWIMVNSWGTRPLRTTGIFHLDMWNTDYNCTWTCGGDTIDYLRWWTIDVTFETERDLEAVSQTHPNAKVVQGAVEPIEVRVRNNGDTLIGPETFDVILYADLDTSLIGDEIMLGPITVHDLASGASTMITFNWDTTGVPGGTYTITAFADSALAIPESDEDNNWCTDPLTLRVTWEPIADINGPYTGDECTLITFDASGSYDPDGTIVLYEWDWDGDGFYDESSTGHTITHHWGDDYSGVVGLRVTDNDGLEDTDTTTVTVKNVAPSIAPFGPFTADEGTQVTLTATCTDPGSDDLTFTWEFELGPTVASMYYNDGASPDPYPSPWGTHPFSATDMAQHTYGDNGIYTVTLTVEDDDGGSTVYTTTVTVNNVAPSISELAMTPPNPENPEFILPLVHEPLFTAPATDPGSDDLTFTWEWGDGTDDTTIYYNDGVGADPYPSPWGTYPFSATDDVGHIYSEPGTYTVTLTVEDDDGGADTATHEITILSAEEAKHMINDYIQALPDDAFKSNPNQRKNALDNMFSAIDDMLDDEEYNGAIQHLQNNIREKTDEAVGGSPKNDWITDPTAQEHICWKIDELIAYLETFL